MTEKPTEKLLRLVAELGGELRKHDGSMLSDEIEVEHGIMDIQAEIERLREALDDLYCNWREYVDTPNDWQDLNKKVETALKGELE